ncbi:MAG TPA: hypothetical protein VHI52_00285, partial [Verrucomicrobiae bacterium]|nr:hypothetical protein [Verrucomicrobiae bacterium]
LSRTNPGSKAARCQSNVRRLLTAWQTYAYDNTDVLPPVLHGGQAQGGNFPVGMGPGWCEGWLDWTLSTDNTNSAFLLNPKWARLALYLGKQADVFKCPADQYLSLTQRSRNWTKRVRSYSLGVGIGQGNALTGPWSPIYRQITRITDFVHPMPAETWVFGEEHPDSINDPAFQYPSSAAFVDTPAAYHNGSCSFSFADGHAEMHRWVASLTAPRVGTAAAQDGQYLNNFGPVSPGDADLHWLSFHTQRLTTSSY